MGVPDVYSADAVGVRVRRRRQAGREPSGRTSCICRPPTTSSTSARPASKIANDFYAMIDGHLGRLDALGCIVVATADHGMNDKHSRRWLAGRRSISSAFRRLARRRQGARHPAHHRPLRGPSRRARLVRHRVCAAGRGCRGPDRQAQGDCPASSSAFTRAEACEQFRVAGRSHRRHRRHLDPAHDARNRARQA